MTHTVVVGAGLAGLAAAWELIRAGNDVTVLESERRAGGLIVSERPEPGWLVEGGPDGFHGAYPDVPELATALGVGDRVIPARARGAFSWDGRGFSPLSGIDAAELLGIETRAEDLQTGFFTFADGMVTLVDALVEAVGGVVRYGVGVTGGQRSARGFRLGATGGMSIDCDGLVLAAPAYAAAATLQGVDGAVAHLLGSIRYRPSLNVSLAYRREQIGVRLDGSGFVTSPELGSPLRACTYASVKFPGRAPDGFVLLRAFLAPETDDAAPVAHEALATALRISGAPRWARVFAWPRALPGRMDPAAFSAWSEELRRRLERLGPVALAGAAYESVAGVSASIRSGRAAGREVVRRLEG